MLNSFRGDVDSPSPRRSLTAPVIKPCDDAPAGVVSLFGPHIFDYATVTLERHPRLALPMLHSVTKKSKLTEEELTKILKMAEELIQMEEHFTVVHDLRQMTAPSRKQTRRVLDWLAGHRLHLDVLIQARQIKSPLVESRFRAAHS
ncbi:MAG: hypothetical protein SGPRY_008021 [Prymnesium sp.]